MLIAPFTITKLASFFSEAALDEDMAKRIFLSIIPSLQSPTERIYTGGFDYKALKSAVNGAKDLVKYGAMACADELTYSKIDTITPGKVNAMIAQGHYLEALQKCAALFNIEKNWDIGFGGETWGKIASTLIEIEQRRLRLEVIRNEAKSPTKNTEINYLDEEVRLMKEIVVWMNVFDGLSHNSGNIMPKLFKMEKIERGEKPEGEDGLEIDFPSIEKARQLMDAKELENPIATYKEIEDFIERPQNRHLFGDWIHRIKAHPNYRAHHNNQADLARIKMKKELIRQMTVAETYLSKAMEAKDLILNSKDQTLKGVYAPLYSLKMSFQHIAETLYYGAQHIGYDLDYMEEEKMQALPQELKDTVRRMTIIFLAARNAIADKNRNVGAILKGALSEKVDTNLLVSYLHQVKKEIVQLRNKVEEL